MPQITARIWFSRFKNGKFDRKNGSHTGRPMEFDEKQFIQLLPESRCQKTREFGKQMYGDNKKQTVVKHLQSVENFINSVLVYHTCSEKTAKIHAPQSPPFCSLDVARYHSTHGHKQLFLYSLVTYDGKCCLHVNMKKYGLGPKIPATPLPKQDLHPQKTCWVYGGTKRA